MPSDSEFTTLEVFTKVMKPLVRITEAIGAEKWVTISAVRPLLYKSMKLAMHSNLSHRYTIAAFLDP